MKIEIYEDQTGLMVYPDTRSEKNNKIVSFFNNDVDLFIEKIGNNLTIYCHLIAYKKSARPLGYYIIYNDVYRDEAFYTIKPVIDKVLQSLGLQPRLGHTDNIIFENIDKLGSTKPNKWSGNATDQIIYALNSFETLEYKGGNTEEILTFYKEILKKIDNIKLEISSIENSLGNINILINKKIQEALIPNDRTAEILHRYKLKIVDNKNKKDTELGKNKIREGTAIVREGANIIKSAGANPSDIIIEEFGKIVDLNNIKPKTDILEKELDPPENKGIGARGLALIGISMLFLGIILGTFVSHHPVVENYLEKKGIFLSQATTPIPIVSNNAIVTTTPIEDLTKNIKTDNNIKTESTTPLIAQSPPDNTTRIIIQDNSNTTNNSNKNTTGT